MFEHVEKLLGTNFIQTVTGDKASVIADTLGVSRRRVLRAMSVEKNADDELKLEITSKLIDCIDQFANNFKWEIDTLIRMIVLCNNHLYDDTLSKVINIIIKVAELKIYSVHKLFIVLKNNMNNEALVKLALYIIGEFCDALVNNSVIGPSNEQISVNIDDLISLLKEVGEKNKNSFAILEYLLNALVKISIKFPNKREEIEEIFESYHKNYFYEVQQRASEYMVLQNTSNNDLKQKVISSIPIPKEDTITDKDLIDENEEEDEEYKIKLQNAPTKGQIPKSQGTGEGFSVPSNIGDILDNMNPNEQSDKKQQTENSGSVNLLDLNNIFGGNPTDNSGQQGGESNPTQPSQNPFDLFLGPEAQGTNNNQPAAGGNLLDFLGNSTSPNPNIPVQEPVPSPQNNEPQMKQCFSNEHMSLYYQINKTSPTNYDGVVYASNNCNETIDNIKINFMVLKFVSLKVLNTSGNTLSPKQGLGIKKDFSIVSNDASKKVVMKIKLVYQIKGVESSSMITLDDF